MSELSTMLKLITEGEQAKPPHKRLHSSMISAGIAASRFSIPLEFMMWVCKQVAASLD